MARLVTQSLTLECILTDDEKLVYSKRLAEGLRSIAAAKATLKAFTSQNKAETDATTADVELCTERISTGREYRLVECTVNYDWERMVKQWIRQDTQEVAREVKITDEEKQEELAFDQQQDLADSVDTSPEESPEHTAAEPSDPSPDAPSETETGDTSLDPEASAQ